RLPVLAIARQANAIALGHPGLLVRAAAIPFLLSLAVAAATLTVPGLPMASVLLAIAGLAPYAIFGVAWSRLSLLGPMAGRPPLLPSWQRRHWRYFGYLVALAIIAFGLVVPTLFMGAVRAIMAAGSTSSAATIVAFFLGELAAVVGVAYVTARLSFVFPAAAADEIYTWRHAWVHTRGQGMRLLATIVMSMAPAVAVLWAVAAVSGIFAFPEIDPAAVPEGASPEQTIKDYLAENAGQLAMAQIALTAMTYLVMGVAMSAIALAFRIGTGWVPAAAAAPPRAPE
ncbi:MAG TPA: hypothetical protein VIK47_06705, partial [Kiloniellales bacterium]